MRLHLPRICLLLALLSVSLSLATCQPASPPVSINDIPVYPGAVEIQPGESTALDAEAEAWLKRDAAERNRAPDGSARRRFRLPKNWGNPEIMPFYGDALKASGWSARWGNVPARQAFDRGSQLLVIYVLVNQQTGEAELLLTLDE